MTTNPSLEVEFGDLPEWNLDDLYPGRDSAELAADLDRTLTEAKAFSAKHKGKLDGLDGEAFGAAITDYEAIEETIGRIHGAVEDYVYGSGEEGLEEALRS